MKNEIKIELQALESSLVNKAFQDLPFNTPKGYFDDLETEIFTKTENNISNDLPEDYFTKLEKTVMSKIQKDDSETKVIPLNWKRYMGIAASILIVIFAGIHLINKDQTEATSSDLFADIPDSEMIEYLANEEDAILYELVAEDEELINTSFDDIDNITDDDLDEILDEISLEELNDLL